jgi:hypothetical protein
MRDFKIDPLLRYVAIVKPKNISAAFSGGPNFSATFAKGGARNISITTAKLPPMKDPKADIPKACPALPLRAIW